MGKKSRLKKQRFSGKTKSSDVEISSPAPKTAPSYHIKHLIFAVVLITLVLLAYSPSINGIYLLDDMHVINKIIKLEHSPSFFRLRSVSLITFYLNKLIAEPSAANFRLTNIFIHIINSLLIYLIVLVTLKLKPAGNTQEKLLEHRDKFIAASACALFFAMHPININAVAYIVQRMASLAVLFVLLSLICYINAYISENRARTWFFYSLSAVSMILGMFSKENAVMGIPLILLYDYIFLSRLDTKRLLKKILTAIGIGIALLITASVATGFHKTILDLLGTFLNLNQPLAHRGWMATDVSWTPLEHILTEFRIVSRYMLLIIAPLPGLLLFDGWGYPVSKSLSAPLTTLSSMLFIIGIISFSSIKRKKYPFLFFGILWYFIAISLESFIAIGSDLYFEHRNYLPMTGLTVGLVIQAMFSIKSLSGAGNRIFPPAVLILIIFMGSFTFQRNFIWQDSLVLWEDTVKKAPYNTRASVTVGKSYFLSSEYDKAEEYFKRSLSHALKMKQNHFYQESSLYLGKIYLINGNIKKAEEVISALNRKVPSSYKLKMLKAFYFSKQNRINEATMFLDQTYKYTRKNRIKVDFLLNLGFTEIFRKTGMLRKAETNYKYMVKEYPDNPLAHYGLAMTYIGLGNLDKANAHIDRALKAHPDNIHALSAKARLVLYTKKDSGEALEYAQKALSLEPPFSEPYLAMGLILIYQGKDKEADRFFEKSKTVWGKAPEHMINQTKADAYLLKEDKNSADIYFKKILDDIDTPEEIKQSVRRRFLH